MAERPIGTTIPRTVEYDDAQKAALVRAELGRMVHSEQKAEQEERGQLSKTASVLVGMSEEKGHSRLSQVKKAVSLSLEHRKAIANGDLSPFIPAFAFGIIKDALFDPLSATLVGTLFGIFFGTFITVYLFIFLWGKGKWKVRLVMFILFCFDVIPVVSLLPFQTICVLYAYKNARKHAKEVRKELRAAGVSI